MDFYESTDDKDGIAFSLWAIAGSLRIKGDILAAIDTFKRALRAFRALRQESSTGYCLCGLGGTSRIAGLFKNSLNYYTKANTLFAGIKDTFVQHIHTAE